MNKILSKIKYPKFLLLVLTFVVAYGIFHKRDFLPFHNLLSSMGYFGVFILGLFFAYGFTAAPATSLLLIIAKEYNLLLAALIAGLGALVADLIIFNFVRHSFADEIEKLFKEKIVVHLYHKTPILIRRYLIPATAGFIIASPLPDEIGVSLFALSRNVSTKTFLIFSYILNTTGIFVILLVGNVI